jgi:hypothetical protein
MRANTLSRPGPVEPAAPGSLRADPAGCASGTVPQHEWTKNRGPVTTEPGAVTHHRRSQRIRHYRTTQTLRPRPGKAAVAWLGVVGCVHRRRQS